MNCNPAKDEHRAVTKPVYDFFKRVLDVILSIIALVILSPVFLIISAAVKFSDGGPVFFKHKRVGKNGKTIKICKFRSMVVNAEELKKNFTSEQKAEFKRNFKLKNDPRITRVGKFLRKTSLDELPQLWNILRGDISIVGPRPVTETEVERYRENKAVLLSVKPGLTGYWAANGRSGVSGARRRAMEIYYVEHRSLPMDVKIIFKTAFSVFRREGAR